MSNGNGLLHGAGVSSLEDFPTNAFLITELTGLKWCCLAGSADQAQESGDHDVLRAYSRCLERNLLCTWRRRPPPQGVQNAYENPVPRPSFPKELWLFWYTVEEPKFVEELKNRGMTVVQHSESSDMDMPRVEFEYETRTLFFKALNSAIERRLLSQGFVRFGRWLCRPFEISMLGQEDRRAIPRFINAIRFNYFLHRDSLVCASISVQRQPAILRLSRRHLEGRRQAQPVILGPWSIRAQLVPDQQAIVSLTTPSSSLSNSPATKRAANSAVVKEEFGGVPNPSAVFPITADSSATTTAAPSSSTTTTNVGTGEQSQKSSPQQQQSTLAAGHQEKKWKEKFDELLEMHWTEWRRIYPGLAECSSSAAAAHQQNNQQQQQQQSSQGNSSRGQGQQQQQQRNKSGTTGGGGTASTTTTTTPTPPAQDAGMPRLVLVQIGQRRMLYPAQFVGILADELLLPPATKAAKNNSSNNNNRRTDCCGCGKAESSIGGSEPSSSTATEQPNHHCRHYQLSICTEAGDKKTPAVMDDERADGPTSRGGEQMSPTGDRSSQELSPMLTRSPAGSRRWQRRNFAGLYTAKTSFEDACLRTKRSVVRRGGGGGGGLMDAGANEQQQQQLLQQQQNRILAPGNEQQLLAAEFGFNSSERVFCYCKNCDLLKGGAGSATASTAAEEGGEGMTADTTMNTPIAPTNPSFATTITTTSTLLASPSLTGTNCTNTSHIFHHQQDVRVGEQKQQQQQPQQQSRSTQQHHQQQQQQQQKRRMSMVQQNRKDKTSTSTTNNKIVPPQQQQQQRPKWVMHSVGPSATTTSSTAANSAAGRASSSSSSAAGLLLPDWESATAQRTGGQQRRVRQQMAVETATEKYHLHLQQQAQRKASLAHGEHADQLLFEGIGPDEEMAMQRSRIRSRLPTRGTVLMESLLEKEEDDIGGSGAGNATGSLLGTNPGLMAAKSAAVAVAAGGDFNPLHNFPPGIGGINAGTEGGGEKDPLGLVPKWSSILLQRKRGMQMLDDSKKNTIFGKRRRRRTMAAGWWPSLVQLDSLSLAYNNEDCSVFSVHPCDSLPPNPGPKMSLLERMLQPSPNVAAELTGKFGLEGNGIVVGGHYPHTAEDEEVDYEHSALDQQQMLQHLFSQQQHHHHQQQQQMAVDDVNMNNMNAETPPALLGSPMMAIAADDIEDPNNNNNINTTDETMATTMDIEEEEEAMEDRQPASSSVAAAEERAPWSNQTIASTVSCSSSTTAAAVQLAPVNINSSNNQQQQQRTGTTMAMSSRLGGGGGAAAAADEGSNSAVQHFLSPPASNEGMESAQQQQHTQSSHLHGAGGGTGANAQASVFATHNMTHIPQTSAAAAALQDSLSRIYPTPPTPMQQFSPQGPVLTAALYHVGMGGRSTAPVTEEGLLGTLGHFSEQIRHCRAQKPLFDAVQSHARLFNWRLGMFGAFAGGILPPPPVADEDSGDEQHHHQQQRLVTTAMDAQIVRQCCSPTAIKLAMEEMELDERDEKEQEKGGQPLLRKQLNRRLGRPAKKKEINQKIYKPKTAAAMLSGAGALYRLAERTEQWIGDKKLEERLLNDFARRFITQSRMDELNIAAFPVAGAWGPLGPQPPMFPASGGPMMQFAQQRGAGGGAFSPFVGGPFPTQQVPPNSTAAIPQMAMFNQQQQQHHNQHHLVRQASFPAALGQQQHQRIPSAAGHHHLVELRSPPPSQSTPVVTGFAPLGTPSPIGHGQAQQHLSRTNSQQQLMNMAAVGGSTQSTAAIPMTSPAAGGGAFPSSSSSSSMLLTASTAIGGISPAISKRSTSNEHLINILMNERLVPSSLVALLLQDTVADLHHDIVFDACPLCCCNSNIRSFELGFYIVGPKKLLFRCDHIQQKQRQQNSGSGSNNLALLSRFWSGFRIPPGTELQKCICGFSAVRHRYLCGHGSGLFPEDIAEAGGIFQQKAAITWTFLWQFNPKSMQHIQLIDLVRYLCVSRDIATLLLNGSRIWTPKQQQQDERGGGRTSPVLELSSEDNYALSPLDNTELDALMRTIVDICAGGGAAASGGTNGLLSNGAEKPQQILHPWGYQIAKAVGEPRDAECLGIFEELRDTLREGPPTSSNNFRRLEQLNLRAFARKSGGPVGIGSGGNSSGGNTGGSSKDIEDPGRPEPMPKIVAMSQAERETVLLAPTVAVRDWDRLELMPLEQSKDVLYMAMVPDVNVMVEKSRVFLEEMSNMYERRCRLGMHVRVHNKDTPRDAAILRVPTNTIITGNGGANSTAGGNVMQTLLIQNFGAAGISEQMQPSLQRCCAFAESCAMELRNFFQTNGHLFERRFFHECTIRQQNQSQATSLAIVSDASAMPPPAIPGSMLSSSSGPASATAGGPLHGPTGPGSSGLQNSPLSIPTQHQSPAGGPNSVPNVPTGNSNGAVGPTDAMMYNNNGTATNTAINAVAGRTESAQDVTDREKKMATELDLLLAKEQANYLPHVVVVYIINPFGAFGSDSQQNRLAQLATTALLLAWNDILSSFGHRCQLQLELIPLRTVYDYTAFMGIGEQCELLDGRERSSAQDLLRKMALNIYAQPRLLKPHVAADFLSRSMTRFGVAETMKQIFQMLGDGPTLFKNCSPFLLAPQRQWSSSSVMSIISGGGGGGTGFHAQQQHQQLAATTTTGAATGTAGASGGRMMMGLLSSAEERVLLLAYCILPGDQWLCATVTDERGSLLDSALINLAVIVPGAPEAGKEWRYKQRQSQIADALHRVWLFAQSVILGQEVHQWRLVIGRIGKLGHGEFKLWTEILSKRNLKAYNASLKTDGGIKNSGGGASSSAEGAGGQDVGGSLVSGNCSACANSHGWQETPALLSACLVSTEVEPHLRVFGTTPSSDAQGIGGSGASGGSGGMGPSGGGIGIVGGAGSLNTGAGAASGIGGGLGSGGIGSGGTKPGGKNAGRQSLQAQQWAQLAPDDHSSTHIMVFQTILNASLGHQLGEDLQVGMEDEFDFLGGCLGGENPDGMDLADLVFEDGVRNEEEAPINNQPMAIGYTVSTAPIWRRNLAASSAAAADNIPDFLFANCPAARHRRIAHLKSSLHINSANLHQSDEYQQQVAAAAATRSTAEQIPQHPLDSVATDEVLRYVLETYNALSWLSIDPVTGSRRSCMPTHMQLIFRLHQSINALTGCSPRTQAHHPK